MTDNDTFAHYNFKDFGKIMCAQVSSYQCINSEPIGFCSDMVCSECGNNHSFRGNFEDAITLIDLLPEIFNSISISKLQEFVN
jgi:hypothetical protein